MGKMYKVYCRVIVVMYIFLIILLGAMNVFYIKDLSLYAADAMKSLVKHESVIYLKNTVDHAIDRIDEKLATTTKEVEKQTLLLSSILESTKEDITIEEIESYVTMMQNTEYGQAVFVVFEYDHSKRFLGKATDITNENDILFLQTIPIALGYIHVFAPKENIYKIVENYVRLDFYNSSYDENEYMWVNKVVNYEGGDNYGIRIIHPNQKETEGSWLSTNTTDIAGNYPYLVELEEIKKSKEVVHSYYFKNKIDDDIVEKISYAKLYEPFDWIVANGIPIHNILDYTTELERDLTRITNTKTWILLVVILVISALSIYLIYAIQKKQNKEIDSYIHQETKKDTLTNAYSRKSADAILQCELMLYKLGKVDVPLIMMLDIDNFKRINDTYGHNVGDIVLQRFVSSVQAAIREQDYLFRWGGEEFILLCKNSDDKHQYIIANRILQCVRETEVVIGETQLRFTVSIGGSFYTKTDSHYTEVIQRADQALYESKRTGKDKYTFYQ